MNDRRKNAAWQFLIIVLPLLVFMASLPVFFFSYTPGTAEQVEGLIRVQGYQPLAEGQFYLTSVTVNDLSTATLAYSKLFRNDEVRSLRGMLGGERNYSDYNARSDVLMGLSKDTAAAVALRQEGFEVGEEAVGVMILAMAADAPIAREAQVGDVIVGMEGREVTNRDGIKEILAGKADRQEVEVTVERGAERLAFRTNLTTAGDGDTTPILGIYSHDYILFDLPLEVTISTEDLTGPSAGLMLTLGIVNVMRGGGLAGTFRVAGTGEIFADGSVGPIGGINFKISAAAEVGAQVFLVPEENYAEITAIPDGLRVYPVKNVEEALSVMESLRGTQ